MIQLKIGRLMAAIGICQLAGVIGSIFTFQSIPTWYAALEKPSFAPPNWLFGPVWLTLYTLMGISLYMVWEKGFKKKENKTALYIFATQLAFNALWSVVFFGLRSTLYGLVTIVAMWVAIAATIISFYKISKRAAWLLVPYIAWVSIAMVLNFYIWNIN